MRPGITGWAQINYKYGDTLEDTIAKLEYDLYYIKNMSFSIDTYIMFHTVKAMLSVARIAIERLYPASAPRYSPMIRAIRSEARPSP